MAVIPFYGAAQPEMFAIERRAMDRPGRVLKALDGALGHGRILDVGAGDGFTAEALQTSRRRVFALEPAAGMIRVDRNCTWIRGEAERLPFVTESFDGAYATWAYFFTRDWDPSPGIAELDRVVTEGGPIVIADNAGNDEFCRLADNDIAADPVFWADRGFDQLIIETEFRFESIAQARSLLALYFGDRGAAAAAAVIEFKVAVFSRPSRGGDAS